MTPRLDRDDRLRQALARWAFLPTEAPNRRAILVTDDPDSAAATDVCSNAKAGARAWSELLKCRRALLLPEQISPLEELQWAVAVMDEAKRVIDRIELEYLERGGEGEAE